VDRLVGAIADHWIEVCDEAGLSSNERAAFAGRQFLNEFAFDGFGRTPVLS
jgi:serine/threonine-protein kinase HipA